MQIGNGEKIGLKQHSSQTVNAVEIRDDHMSSQQKAKMKGIVSEYPELFIDPNQKLTCTTRVVGEIRTSTDTPVYSKQYPYPMALKSEVEKQIKNLLDHQTFTFNIQLTSLGRGK